MMSSNALLCGELDFISRRDDVVVGDGDMGADNDDDDVYDYSLTDDCVTIGSTFNDQTT